jgi:hypothetical protein
MSVGAIEQRGRSPIDICRFSTCAPARAAAHPPRADPLNPREFIEGIGVVVGLRHARDPFSTSTQLSGLWFAQCADEPEANSERHADFSAACLLENS